ncbi:NADH-ubiquinone oxidoreductase 14 kDa subunit [Cryomyces antarcticus]|uniref:NADH-ubiquinone oxidoreductase 14 kDa subunit n=1 Tax=Cryomyces antarcticus TaxID=329879 RepID=A0ABR0JXK1_9PEZI|nr:hypothetical protein LTR39_002888 [Cryomyces antarcticus]KAK5079471.1 hypothetical protein LTR16_008657 [Cryomyces antarcticus]
MVHKVLFWSGFGIAVRFWQLGIEMRPFFNIEGLWAYPVYAALGGSFGYWLKGVEGRQFKILADRRDRLLEKRRRASERQELNMGTPAQLHEESFAATTS